MPVLFPFLPFDPNETPLSYASRLASFHIDATLVPFLHDIGVRPDALAGGEADAVARLAEVAGLEGGAPEHNAARRTAKRRFDLRGEELTAEFFSSPDTMFCPACLREDDAEAGSVAAALRGRLEWTFRTVRTCPRHGLALIRRKKQRWDDQYRELARIVPERGLALDCLIEQAAARSTSPLQDYILARFEGEGGPEWLDGQKVEQAVRSSEMLGMRIAFGAAKNRQTSRLTNGIWQVARATRSRHSESRRSGTHSTRCRRSSEDRAAILAAKRSLAPPTSGYHPPKIGKTPVISSVSCESIFLKQWTLPRGRPFSATALSSGVCTACNPWRARRV